MLPVVIYVDECLIREIDDKVLEQSKNVATLLGSLARPPSCVTVTVPTGFPSAESLRSKLIHSRRACRRQRHEMGTLGSGNHQLEAQRVAGRGVRLRCRARVSTSD